MAIDGTAGSGKSTTARKAAEILGFFYLDTGAMYRAITWKIIKSKIDLCDAESLKKLVANTKIDITEKKLTTEKKAETNSTTKTRKHEKKEKPLRTQKNSQIKQEQRHELRIVLDGKDVTKQIRRPEVDGMVSQVSVLPLVRKKMVKEQQRVVHNRNVICEGRDIGSVVFPHAHLKLYLDCDLNERTKRREKELKEKGIKATAKGIKENFLERDYIDSTRTYSPLKKMPDAIFLDTTNLTIEEEVKIVIDLIKEKLKRQKLTTNNQKPKTIKK